MRPIFRIKEAEMTNAYEMTAWDFNSSELPYYDQLYKTALRMTRSVAETEDLLQETYLKAFRYYSGFKEGTNLKAWLFRIMKNNFINGYRKRKVQPQHVELDELRDSGEEHAGVQGAFAEDGSEAGFLAEEMDGDVARAINAIPHDYKMALLLICHGCTEVAPRSKRRSFPTVYVTTISRAARERSATQRSIWRISSMPRPSDSCR
jgi:RNA polymerase sigma factor (sigma-70 family)